jgi:DinB superfamily
MPTMEEVAKQPLEQRLGNMTRTADHLAAAIRGHGEAALVRRPDAQNWAAKEVICHLRDTEELFMLRLEMIASMDEPLFPAAGMGARAMNLKSDGHPAAPDRGAEDRQYLRNDAVEALGTFR